MVSLGFYRIQTYCTLGSLVMPIAGVFLHPALHARIACMTSVFGGASVQKGGGI